MFNPIFGVVLSCVRSDCGNVLALKPMDPFCAARKPVRSGSSGLSDDRFIDSTDIVSPQE